MLFSLKLLSVMLLACGALCRASRYELDPGHSRGKMEVASQRAENHESSAVLSSAVRGRRGRQPCARDKRRERREAGGEEPSRHKRKRQLGKRDDNALVLYDGHGNVIGKADNTYTYSGAENTHPGNTYADVLMRFEQQNANANGDRGAYVWQDSKKQANKATRNAYKDNGAYEWKDSKKQANKATRNVYEHTAAYEWKDSKKQANEATRNAYVDTGAYEWKDSKKQANKATRNAYEDKGAYEWKDSKKQGNKAPRFAYGYTGAYEWKDSNKQGNKAMKNAYGDTIGGYTGSQQADITAKVKEDESSQHVDTSCSCQQDTSADTLQRRRALTASPYMASSLGRDTSFKANSDEHLRGFDGTPQRGGGNYDEGGRGYDDIFDRFEDKEAGDVDKILVETAARKRAGEEDDCKGEKTTSAGNKKDKPGEGKKPATKVDAAKVDAAKSCKTAKDKHRNETKKTKCRHQKKPQCDRGLHRFKLPHQDKCCPPPGSCGKVKCMGCFYRRFTWLWYASISMMFIYIVYRDCTAVRPEPQSCCCSRCQSDED